MIYFNRSELGHSEHALRKGEEAHRLIRSLVETHRAQGRSTSHAEQLERALFEAIEDARRDLSLKEATGGSTSPGAVASALSASA
ncbi:MAG: hypothetical protein JWL93_2236 [Hyphomicrobiales bacterium]|nr:hypothetical protein [Hyphomicrobiales bacterium]